MSGLRGRRTRWPAPASRRDAGRGPTRTSASTPSWPPMAHADLLRSPSRCRGSARQRLQRGRGRGAGAPAHARPDHRPDGAQRRSTRSSSLVAEARAAPRGSRRAARAAIASPHSMSVTPPSSSSSARPRSSDLAAAARGGRRRRGAARRRPVVRAGQRERRAGDRLGRRRAPRPKPWANAVLPGAELAGEQDEVAGPRELGQRRRPARLRVVDRRRCAARPSRGRRSGAASASLARTKSARICASGSPPPRSTAAGCSVGIEHAVARTGRRGRAAW